MSNTKNFLSHSVMLAIGFGAAQVPSGEIPSESFENNLLIMEEITPEVCLVNIKKIEGEDLFIQTKGNVKIEWSDGRVSEENSLTIPLSQIPTQDYLDIQKAAFLANLKTNKFYPASSYHARCVAPHNRKLFDSKQEAIDAGFIPSKNVK